MMIIGCPVVLAVEGVIGSVVVVCEVLSVEGVVRSGMVVCRVHGEIDLESREGAVGSGEVGVGEIEG